MLSARPTSKERHMAYDRTHRPVIAAGIVLGIGVGGFIDGIFLHQIFQLHSMLSG
jgi:uncharacterized membrane protein